MDPKSEYGARLAARQAEVDRGASASRRIGNLRLVVAIAAVAIAFFVFGETLISPWWLLPPLIIFAILVVIHSRMEERLTRIWIALRELSAAPYDHPESRDFLLLWEQALGAWTSAAAWYGLHGHLYAGRLAATNSVLKIRAATDWSRAEHAPAHYIEGAKGGRASEYYSMAKMMPTSAQRDQYLALALADLGQAMASISGDVSGYLAIRGHVLQEQGRLEDARRDFEEMSRLRAARGDIGGQGEAYGDLGLVQLRLGNVQAARRLLTEGADMLAQAGRYPFLLRVKKRLAMAHARSLHPYQAFREMCEAYEIARDRQIYDQITPLMEQVHHWGTVLGVWRDRSRLP